MNTAIQTKRGLSFLIGFLFLTSSIFAQKITVSGKVIEKSSEQPVEFAMIMLADKTTKSAITGATTDINGNFKMQTENANFYIEVTFIGFQKKTIETFEIVNGNVNLGAITLSEDSEMLEEVEVVAEKSQTIFKLDKRVFNVGSDLSSTGASAYEVLNNVPSVNVNIEGVISLRGSSGVQILINGKPSVIASEQGNALGTITADMIEKVEVITNPSAKYEAEGTSGIINIVLKKEERKGINGSVSLNTGWPQNHSIGLSLNRRTEKFNLFSQLGVGYRELPRFGENINQDLVNDQTIFSEGTEYRNEQFYNIILGTDYIINPRNIITLSGSYAYEVEDQPSRNDFRLEDENGVVAEWYRTETTQATNPKLQYELQYKSDFKDHKDHVLLFSAIGNVFAKDQESEFENITTFGNLDNESQQTRTNFSETKYTFQLDYTKPFSKNITMETGAMYVIQDVQNDFAVADFINGEWINDAGLTNIFEYNQNVLGLYGTGSYETGDWGFKAGVRYELTDLQTLLVNTNVSNTQNFGNFFPSGFVSYKFSDRFSMQTGYSRRIYRPRLWDLNPFFNIRNNFVVRAGNPELQPEFTDSYEISSIYILDKVSLNFSVYHRYTTEVIERISLFDDNITTFKPFNIGTNQATGFEFNTKISPNKWLTFNGDVNINYFNRKGEFEGQNFDFDATVWSTKWTGKVKLPKDFDVELVGRYESEEQMIQGVKSDVLFADLGVRKKIVKGKAVVSLGVRDIFASRVRETEMVQPTFYTYSRNLRGRFVTLSFSYGFGKGEAMEYSGQKRRH
ncbi:MAG: TonB-dependent receptor [Saprospiraceae bacterium]